MDYQWEDFCSRPAEATHEEEEAWRAVGKGGKNKSGWIDDPRRGTESHSGVKGKEKGKEKGKAERPFNERPAPY